MTSQETAKDLIDKGYYIRLSTDSFKKLKQYEIIRDISDTEIEIYCELNFAGYLLAKNDFHFPVKKVESGFCNFTPFAERNKEKLPLMEQTKL